MKTTVTDVQNDRNIASFDKATHKAVKVTDLQVGDVFQIPQNRRNACVVGITGKTITVATQRKRSHDADLGGHVLPSKVTLTGTSTLYKTNGTKVSTKPSAKPSRAGKSKAESLAKARKVKAAKAAYEAALAL